MEGSPDRDDVIEYLERFAAEHQLSIRFGTELLTVERDGELWRLVDLPPDRMRD